MLRKSFLFVIVLSCISFLLMSSLSILNQYKYWDETIYVNLGRNLVLYGDYSFSNGFSDFALGLPNAGIRPPMLPFIIFFLSLFSLNDFWLNFITPLISSFGIIFLFLLCEKLFNQRVALISSILFFITPSFFFWGSKILNDSIATSYLIIASYFFFNAFILEGDFRFKRNCALLFGLFIGLSFLSRYNSPWIFPLFFVILLIRNKNFSFLFERNFLYSISLSFLVVLPWFIFNYFSYGSVFGFLLSSSISSVIWGFKPILFYFKTLIRDYVYFLPFLIIGFFVSFKLKIEPSKKYFFPLWFFIIFICASLTPAKEDRYLLLIAPSILVISSLAFYYISKKSKLLFYILYFILLSILLFKVSNFYFDSYENINSEDKKCFFSVMDFIKKSNSSAVITEYFSPVYYYTLKPNIRVNNYNNLEKILKKDYLDKEIYYFYVDGDWFNLNKQTNNFKEIYTCGKYNLFVFKNASS